MIILPNMHTLISRNKETELFLCALHWRLLSKNIFQLLTFFFVNSKGFFKYMNLNSRVLYVNIKDLELYLAKFSRI